MCHKVRTAKGLLDKLPHLIGKSPGLTQLAIGAITGLSAGCAVMKFGKTAVAVAGTSILVAQVAHSQGFGSMDWKLLKTKAQQATKTIDTKYNNTKFATTMKGLSETNPYFSAGFTGGFLIGLAI